MSLILKEEKMLQGWSSQYHRIHSLVQESLQEWRRNSLWGFWKDIGWSFPQQSISGWLPDSWWNFQHLQQQRRRIAKQGGIQHLLEKLDQEDLEASKRPHCGRRAKRLHLRKSFFLFFYFFLFFFIFFMT